MKQDKTNVKSYFPQQPTSELFYLCKRVRENPFHFPSLLLHISLEYSNITLTNVIRTS